MNSGDHDQLGLSPEEANKLSADFWNVYLGSKYPDGYMRTVIKEQSGAFMRDFVAASTALVTGAEEYLGYAQPGKQPEESPECTRDREEGTP